MTVSGGLFLFNGASTFEMVRGYSYEFIYTSSHPLAFSTTSDGTHGGGTEYTSGITRSGNILSVKLDSNSPDVLYSYCTAHSGMGRTHEVEDFYLTIPENDLNKRCVAKFSQNAPDANGFTSKVFLVICCPQFAGSISSKYGLLSVFKIQSDWIELNETAVVSQIGTTFRGESFASYNSQLGMFGIFVSDTSNNLIVEGGTIVIGEKLIHLFKINEANNSIDEISVFQKSGSHEAIVDMDRNNFVTDPDISMYYDINSGGVGVYSIGDTELNHLKDINLYIDLQSFEDSIDDFDFLF